MNSPDLIINIVIFLVGITGLLLGGNALVKGASNIARILGISPLVIGLTIVAFGTSSPEFLVGIIAAVKGSSDIATGNIVGSNISNIGLILGLTTLVCAIGVHTSVLKVQTPFMIFLSIILYLFCLNLSLGMLEGFSLFLLLCSFIVYNYFQSKKEISNKKKNKHRTDRLTVFKQVLLITVGLVGLIIGAKLVVDKSILFARTLGVSELIISITAVAVGTSLPELAASIIAAIKKENDLIVGNIVGSNIFNLGILGLISFIQPIEVNPSLLKFELPVMLILSIIIFPIMMTGKLISRIEGFILLLIYSGFIYFLF